MRRSLRSLITAALGGAVLLTAALPALPAAALTPTACRVRIAGDPTLHTALQDAIDAAGPGADLTLRGVCDGPVWIDQDISITGIRPRGAARPEIRATEAGSTVRTYGGTPPVVRLEDLRITGGTGSGSLGGGIYNSGLMTLIDVVITSNSAPSHGGGILILPGATVVLGGTTAIFGNDGGGVWNEGTLRMGGRSVIRDHQLTGQGAGVYLATSAVLRMSGRSRITGNTATLEGGGVYATLASSIEMSGRAAISGNKGTGGGGLLLSGASLTMSRLALISTNTATSSSGGGVLASEGTIALSGDARITGNKALSGDGGGIRTDSALTLAGSAIVSGNKARYGGGVLVSGIGTITMSDASLIRGNTASVMGGGLHAAAEGATTGVVCGTNVRQNSAPANVPLFADCFLFQPG